jgi:hypothetical protein
MQFFFSYQDSGVRTRARDIRAALVHAGHRVRQDSDPSAVAPAETDVWMYGLGMDGGPPIGDGMLRQLIQTKAELAIFQLCDAQTMVFERIPDALRDKARLFLRNHWPADSDAIVPSVQDRIGWLPPMIKAIVPEAGKPLLQRSGGALFYGTRTGGPRLHGDRNAREETVRLMRQSGMPFRGGLVAPKSNEYATDPALIVPGVTPQQHGALLMDSRVCLAPWGNHQLTYRFFEGLAARCLVVAQSLRGCRFLDGGIEPGRHYVEAAADLSNLPDLVRYYLDHLDEAQRIADAGYEHYVKYLAPRGGLVSEWIFDATVASWGSLYRPARLPALGSRLKATLAQRFPWLF